MKTQKKSALVRDAHQERGQKRQQSLLDATEALILETGVEGFAMAAVAKRAGAAHGSLYQFFPSRTALLVALHARQMARLQSALAQARERIGGGPKLPGAQAFLDAYLEPLQEFLRNNPSYRVLRIAMPADWPGADTEANLDAGVIDELTGVLVVFAPRASSSQRRVAATVLLELVDALVIMETSKDIAEEALRILKLYLEDLKNRYSD